MALRDELVTWCNNIVDPNSPVTELGQVIDDNYGKIKSALKPYIGIDEDDVNNVVTIKYSDSEIKTKVDNSINTAIAGLLTVEEVI